MAKKPASSKNAGKARKKPAPRKLAPPAAADAPKRGRGRPSKYRPEFAAVARALCSRGATDLELAAEFKVSVDTIWYWQTKHEDFCRAVKIEKGEFDDRIERSLAQRAAGWSQPAAKFFMPAGGKAPVRVDYLEHFPPDPGAAKNWLAARRAKEWREVNRQELSGPDGGPIEVATSNKRDLARWIAYQLTTAASSEKPKS